MKHWIGVDKPKVEIKPFIWYPPARNWYDSDNDPQSPLEQDLESNDNNEG